MSKVNKKKNKANTRYNDEQEIKNLKNRIIIELPCKGKCWNNPNILKNNIHAKNTELPTKRIVIEDIMTPDLFSDLPISRRTLEGLRAEDYYQMTLIQKNALPHSLQGRDIIGQARTGSGKTLAFVIPTLENIYRGNYCSLDGLLALILTPTRELASQVFDVIKEIGKFHSTLSAGCIVGGKNIKSESSRINMLNILVATPGRLIQHMDESPLWDANNLKILVIDEVDRMLDMGFLSDIKIILDGIPSPSTGRQTMVFSATVYSSEQSIKKIENLFRTDDLECFSLDNVGKLPRNLQQLYINVNIHEKIDTLFNFLRTHSNKKIIVFVSCCKQVRFLSTVFTKLKIGCKVLELHGKQSLQKRLEVVHSFYTHENSIKFNEKHKFKNIKNNSKFSNGAVLFCTDIASRGLDFPKIDWVIQLDVPENADTYIHRIGRTARYVSKGKSLLFLMYNEAYFLKNLYEKGIDTLKKVIPNDYEMRYTIHSSLQSLCASDQNIKDMAERAFSAYIKSLFILTPSEKREDLKQLEFSAFALSLGLAIPPKIKFKNIENDKNLISKHFSKLQKFKEKMKQKKLLKQSIKKDIDGDKLNILQNNEIETMSTSLDDIVIYPNNEPIINQEKFEIISVNEKTAIDKLRFRSDYSGKIRGYGNSDFDKQHIFFSDEDPGIFNEDNKYENSDIDCQMNFIEQVKNRLKIQTENDKERDRERVHQMHVKKRRILRSYRKEQSNDVDEVEFIESEEDEKSGIYDDDDNLHNLTTAALGKLGIQI